MKAAFVRPIGSSHSNDLEDEAPLAEDEVEAAVRGWKIDASLRAGLELVEAFWGSWALVGKTARHHRPTHLWPSSPSRSGLRCERALHLCGVNRGADPYRSIAAPECACSAGQWYPF